MTDQRQYVRGRFEVANIRAYPNRDTAILQTEHGAVISTYTLDYTFVTPLEQDDRMYRRILPAGTVLAYHPTTGKVVPNYTSYGFGVIGVSRWDSDLGAEGETGVEGDRTVSVIHRGIVFEDNAWDNGTLGTVLQATKDVLARRVDFIKTTSDHPLTYYGEDTWNVY
jgi:hypothetical protein